MANIKKTFSVTLLFMCCFLLYYFHNSFTELDLSTYISRNLDRHFTRSSSPSPTTSTKLHQTTSRPVNKVEPVHQTTSSPANKVEPVHQTTSSPVNKVEPVHQTTSSPVNKVEPVHQTGSSLVKNIVPKQPARPNTCKGCFQNSFDILLENTDICKTKPGHKLDMVIIIFTYLKSTNRRNVIRKTWTQHTKNNTGNTRYFFAFGKYPIEKSNMELAKEAKAHGDLVQASFGESYYNLTYKTLTMFGWVAKNCRNAKLVMKTDDDMWVNIPKIIQRFNREPLSKTIAGACMTNARPIRSKASKWYASEQQYPRNGYPDFCSGTGYVMDIDTAIDIHKTSVDVPFLYLEDVYVALCLEHLGKAYHVRSTFGFHNGKYPMENLCRFKSFVLTSHYMSPQDIQKIWDAKC